MIKYILYAFQFGLHKIFTNEINNCGIRIDMYRNYMCV